MSDGATVFFWFIGIAVLILIPIVIFLNNVSKNQTPHQAKADVQKKPEQKRANSALETVEGYSIKYTYEDVRVCVWNGEIPKETKSDNRIVLIQEKNNRADKNAVLLMLAPQKKKLGYLYRGKLKDMAYDYLERGDKITARISKITQAPPDVYIDMVFYVKNK